MSGSAQREHLGKLMDLLVAHKAKIHYRQLRPMATHKIVHELMLRTLLTTVGISMDCSESVTLLCHLAGLRDPNGRGYDGSGYTGTLLQHLQPHYSDPAHAQLGALVIFGPGTGEHVCMVREPHTDNPKLFSHGGEAGPFFIRLHDEARYHDPPVRFCPITALLS